MLPCGLKLYSRIKDRDTILEVWGGSTKHPDCMFHFDNFKMPECWKNNPDINQSNPVFIYQWLIQCASDMMWWWATKEITDFANYFYENAIDK